jgi:hypothetical protein
MYSWHFLYGQGCCYIYWGQFDKRILIHNLRHALFKILSSFLSFHRLIIVCLNVDLFEGIMCGVNGSSYMFVFTNFGNFSVFISSNSLFPSPPHFLFLSSLYGTSATYILIGLMVFHKSLRLSSHQSLFFLFLGLYRFTCIFSLTLCFAFTWSNLPLNSSKR